MASKEFEDISIPSWKLSLADAAGKVYRVFKNAHEFELVEAENASEAIRKCGTQDVYMVKFGNVDTSTVLPSDALAKMEAAIAEPTPSVV